MGISGVAYDIRELYTYVFVLFLISGRLPDLEGLDIGCIIGGEKCEAHWRAHDGKGGHYHDGQESEPQIEHRA